MNMTGIPEIDPQSFGSRCPWFWTFGRYEFASRRLRDALAQPGDVVQFLPFDLVRASAAARAQDYRWMRVLALREGLDLARCVGIKERPHAVTGKPVRSFSSIDFFALRQYLAPRGEIFGLKESPTYMLVTDAVAGRVLRAGCTGMEFSDPANRQGGKRIVRYRTPMASPSGGLGFSTETAWFAPRPPDAAADGRIPYDSTCRSRSPSA